MGIIIYDATDWYKMVQVPKAHNNNVVIVDYKPTNFQLTD